MKLLSLISRPAPVARTPSPLVIPVMNAVHMDMQYHRARSGGDFFDVVSIDTAHIVFLLADIAGRRMSAQDLAAFMQDEFRSRTPKLFANSDDPSEALSELCLLLNRNILATAGRAHMTAAFLGALDATNGTLTYINAGHVPGLLLSPGSNEFLESTGLPLGLFSHATHDACLRIIPAGGALLMASRGVVEARCESGVLDCIGRSSEFGPNGLLKATAGTEYVAQSLCRIVLDTALVHAGSRIENDMSIAAISRDLESE